MIARVVILFFLLIFVTAKSPVQGREDTPVPIEVLPIELENNRIRLTASLDGVPLSLLLDTGASTTVLFSNMEPVIQTKPSVGEAQVVFPALDQTVTGQRLAPVTLTFDGLDVSLENVIQLDDKSDLRARLLLRYDGILGQEFFSKYILEIDPGSRELRLYAQGTDLGPNYRTSHKLYMQDNAPHIRFRTKMPWETLPSMKQMLVDTGYPGALVFWDSTHYRKAARLTPEIRQKSSNTAIVGRTRFKFGRLTFMEVPVFLGSHPPKQVGKRDGLMGGTILNNFSYAIDISGERMWMLARREGNNYARQIDGTFYPPNDEAYVFSDFRERPTAVPIITIEVN